MTYEEFKEKVEKIVPCTMLWYEYKDDEIILVYLDGLLVKFKLARFNLKDERSYVIYYTNLKSLIDLTDDTIYKNIKELVEELVETPIEERVQEQKYYIKLKLPETITISDERKFVNEVTRLKQEEHSIYYTLSNKKWVKSEWASWRPQFTSAEFEEIIPEEYRNSFELIPIEEEE